MIDTKSIGALPCVKDLAEGFSTQSRFSNRIWLALIALVIVALSPEVVGTNGKKKLPFSLGEIDGIVFDFIHFFILCSLVIAFCSSRAACLIAYKLAHKKIDELGEERDIVVKQRQYFDMLTSPGFIRVGPLGVLSQEVWMKSKLLKTLQTVYYLLIRNLALILFLGLPFCAILSSFVSLCNNQNIYLVAKIFAGACGILAIVPIVHLWIVESSITKKVREILHISEQV